MNMKRLSNKHTHLFFVYTAILMLSACKACTGDQHGKVRLAVIEIHTFKNPEIQANSEYPNELKEIIKPLDDANIVFSEIVFSDQIFKKRKTTINLESFSENNGGIKIDRNINTAKMLLDRYFDSKDEHSPKNTHILYSMPLKDAADEPRADFDFDKYSAQRRGDTTIGFFIWVDQNAEKNPEKRIYNEQRELRKAIANFLKKEPWKTVVVAYKPNLPQVEKTEETITSENDSETKKEANPNSSNKPNELNKTKPDFKLPTIDIKDNKFVWKSNGKNYKYDWEVKMKTSGGKQTENGIVSDVNENENAEIKLRSTPKGYSYSLKVNILESTGNRILGTIIYEFDINENARLLNGFCSSHTNYQK
jgi:hypothetical protein